MERWAGRGAGGGDGGEEGKLAADGVGIELTQPTDARRSVRCVALRVEMPDGMADRLRQTGESSGFGRV